MARPQIIHLTGRQGSGKTTLGQLIQASLTAQGKLVRFPQQEDVYTPGQLKEVIRNRQCKRIAYAKDNPQPDVILVEHQDDFLITRLEKGDQVISVEVAR